MQQALEHVRREMGLDAVILQTKEISSRRFVRRRTEVEVTASLDVKTASSEVAEHAVKPVASTFDAPQQASGLIDRRRLVPRAPAGIDLLSDPSGERTADERPPAPADWHGGPETEADVESLTDRLKTIEELLIQFSHRTSGQQSETIPDEVFHHYTQLIDADVPERHARRFVLELQEQIERESLTSESDAQRMLYSQLESQFRCSGPIAVTSGQQRVVALVGPTGVGKTTTIAKLAANFRLREGVKLGLVTVDTYRVAAVEQLRTYAEIIDLPMKVVTSPIEMRRAIDELQDMDLILIDTAGRSPREELQLQELKALLAEAQVDEVHLVLSLASCSRMLRMTAERFAPVGVTSLILTKLDEAVGMGTLLSLARESDWPMSYFTTGQDVPDDIETATSARASRLVLGTEKLFPD